MVIYSAEARFWDKSQIPWRKITVPSGWWNRFAQQAFDLRKCGFGAIQCPPWLKTQSGAADTGDGYGWDGDLDDIGTKNFNFSVATRFGLGQELLRMTANLNAVGMQTGANIVTHQATGGKNGSYSFPNWAGVAGSGWTKWNQDDFRDWRGEDPVWEQPDFGFGNEFVYYLARPAGYTEKTMIAGWERLHKRIGFQFARLDDVKGEYVPFVRDLVSASGLSGLRFIAEDFDGSASQLMNWWRAMATPANVSLYDFDTHWALQQILSQSYGNCLALNGRGLNAAAPFNSVEFVDNADTDLSDGQQVISAKRRCYAWLLTVEGEPQIYHKDYAADADCYGLKDYIDPMIWCHQIAANGPTVTRWADARTIVLERVGSPGLLSAFSTDAITAWTRTVQTNFKPGTWLRSFTGQHKDIRVGSSGEATFTIPSDYFGSGNSYLMFAPADLAGMKFEAHPQYTTQHVFAADDRDVAPAIANSAVDQWPFWCAVGSKLTIAPQGKYDGVTFQMIGPGGNALAGQTVPTTGWYTLRATNKNSADAPTEVAVTYMGTHGLTDAEAKVPVPPLNVVTKGAA